jgi:GDPmannose 4,6-dehydratase
MLQQDQPEDFVIATGRQFSVRSFVDYAAALLNMQIEWRGTGIAEEGIDLKSGRTVVRVDPRYFRPSEVETLLGDSSKAREKLGWQPETSFEQLVREMIDHDVEIAKRDAMVAQQGFKTYRHHE